MLFNLCFQAKTGKGTINENEVPCSEWEAADNSDFLKNNKKEKFADIFHENAEKVDQMKEVKALQGHP